MWGCHSSGGGCVAPQTRVERGNSAGVVLRAPRHEAARICCSAPLELEPSAQPGWSNQAKLLRKRKGVFLSKIRLHPGKDEAPSPGCGACDGHRHPGGSAADGASPARLEGSLCWPWLSFRVAQSIGKRAGHWFDLETLLFRNRQDLACFRGRKKVLQLQRHPSGA